MYSEFDMSNSDLFLIEKDQDSIELTFLLRSKQEEFSKETSPIANSEVAQEETYQKQRQEKDEHESEVVDKIEDHGKETNAVKERKTPTLGEVVLEDNDEGFLTPTSPEHKIPVMTECPPTPRKPKTLPSTKRKFSFDAYVDVFDEIGMLFTPVLTGVDCKIKKVRAPKTTSI